MSELIQKNDNRAAIRWKLLTGVSALVLIAASPAAAGEDSNHPLVWIEFGGSLDGLSGTGDRFEPDFMTITPVPDVYREGSPIALQKPSRFSYGENGSITFQPEDSDWIFSAAIHYGRSNNKRTVHAQKPVMYTVYDVLYPYYPPGYLNRYFTKTSADYAETRIRQSEHHMVLDFQAGKDVGLGIFGHQGESVLSAGVRVARFDFNSDVTVRARPDAEGYAYLLAGFVPIPEIRFTAYYFHGDVTRSFHGVGPSLSWKASAPIAGNSHDGELSLDWGISGSVLFGKQKAKIYHHTTEHRFHMKYYYPKPGYPSQTTHYTAPASHPPQTFDRMRSRSVTVPNFGGSIGVSYRIEDFKVSVGYRADYFFGAVDGGIDTAKKTTLGFNGPYASISIGIGD